MWKEFIKNYNLWPQYLIILFSFKKCVYTLYIASIKHYLILYQNQYLSISLSKILL